MADAFLQDEVLAFWFGDLDKDGVASEAMSKRWYVKNEIFDKQIKEKFLVHVEKAQRGEYDHWISTPKGMVALVILLDQFPRNLFRKNPKSFESDMKAQQISLEAIDRGVDVELPHSWRQFMYMPLMHAESKFLQKRSVEMFANLHDAVPETHKERFGTKYAELHAAIIEKFGRFPFRNTLLGRETTPEETEFLKGPNSSF